MTRTHYLGLRFKLTLISSLILILTFGVLSTILISAETKYLRRNLENEVQSLVSLSTQPVTDAFLLYKDSGEIQITKQVRSISDISGLLKSISIVNVDGEVLFSQNSDKPEISADMAGTFEPIYQKNGDGLVSRVINPVIESNGVHRFALIYDIQTKEITTQIKRQTMLLFGLCLLGLVLSIAGSVVGINFFIIKPIRRISSDAADISSGDLGRQIPVRGHDEMAGLALAVNTMAQGLKDDIAKLKQVDAMKSEFMQIASHNLRTPLSTMEGYLDLLNSDDAEVRHSSIEGIRSSTRRLSTFAEDILTVTQVEGGQHVFSSTVPVELSKFLQKIIKDFVSEAKLKNVTVSMDAPEQTRRSPINQPYLRMAILNLLDNALKFSSGTPGGGHVSIKLSESAKEALISISDNGSGIAPEELEHLFTKFHRGTSTEKYNYEGEGIGLYVTKLIIERHAGKIEVDSEVGHGSNFTVHLPLLPKEIRWQYNDNLIEHDR